LNAEAAVPAACGLLERRLALRLRPGHHRLDNAARVLPFRHFSPRAERALLLLPQGMPDDSPPPPPPGNPARRVSKGLADDTTRNEGSTILPDAQQRPLEIIGDFEVMSKLGQGGMGAVYRARQG